MYESTAEVLVLHDSKQELSQNATAQAAATAAGNFLITTTPADESEECLLQAFEPDMVRWHGQAVQEQASLGLIRRAEP